jgi:hypothetical protein
VKVKSAIRMKDSGLSRTPKDENPKQKAFKTTIVAEEFVPERLKSYVGQDIWASWSPVRRDSFKQLLENPNAFFYRNRPPGDPQKIGPFTAEEEKAFMHRLNYFREELNVDNGFWGLFSVPIRGRLGYQCSNFYRQLVKDGRIKTERYEFLPDGKLHCKNGFSKRIDPAVMKRLEKEAFDFIRCCITSENGEIPQVGVPIWAESGQPYFKTKIPPKSVTVKSSEDLAAFFGRKRNLAEKRFDPGWEMTEKAREESFRKEWSLSGPRNRCPLVGARDPLSHNPMLTPMMDGNGFVMDLSSWKRVFDNGEAPPCPLVAQSEKDLVELTAENFNDLKLYVVNIAC